VGPIMRVSSLIRTAILGIAVSFLGGCMMPHMQLQKMSDLKPDEIIYIGSITFEPHISKDEVIYKNVINLSDQELYKNIYIKASDAYYELEGKHGFDLKSSVPGQEGENYYFTWKKDKPLYLLGVSFFTRWTSRNRESMTLVIKNGIQVKHDNQHRAVYIGDITFKRDEFFNIEDIDISQSGYKRAVRDFHDKYGTQIEVGVAKLFAARE